MADKQKIPGRFDQKIEDLLRRPSSVPAEPTQVVPKDAKVDPSNPEAGKVTPEEKVDREDGVVEIPVGGIDPVTGTVYEQVVRPDGNEPIYKEVNIDTEQPAATTETPKATETEKTDTSDK